MTTTKLNELIATYKIASIRQLAIATGLNYQSLCMWVSGKRNVPNRAVPILTAHFETLRKVKEIDDAFDNFVNGY